METVMKQLIEARNIIEEYKIKLKKKEAEAEKYKRQLKVLLGEKWRKAVFLNEYKLQWCLKKFWFVT